MAEGLRTRQLLERERELERLGRLIETSRDGSGAAALIEGPPGIGKSSLIESVRSQGEGQGGIRFLEARCSPLESELPFGVVLHLLGPVVHRHEDPTSGLFQGVASAALPLLDATAKGADQTDHPDPDGAMQILHGLYWLIANLTEEGPLVLTVDDIQWSDRLSLRFLLFLAHRIDEIPVTLITVGRSGEQGASPDLVEALRQLPDVEIIHPDPLSAGAVSTLVHREFPGATSSFAEAVAAVTAGNPLYVKALLQAARDKALPPSQEGVEPLRKLTPEALLRDLTAWLAQVPEAEAALARAVAVLGDGVELHQAAAVAGIGIDEAGAAADSLHRRGLLSRAAELCFSHLIVRDTLYAGIPEAERGGLHLRAAEVLRTDNAPVDVVANQLIHARTGREQWVVDVLVEAASVDRMNGAPESAATRLERALREGGGLKRRAEILLELGLAEATVGAKRGMELISAAAEAMNDPDQRAFALMNLARILGIRGRYRASAEVFGKAHAVLAGTGSELLWWAEAGQAVSGSHDPATRDEARQQLEQLLSRPDLEGIPIGRTVLGFAALERIYAVRPRHEAIEVAERISRRAPEDIEMDGVAYRIAAMAFAMAGATAKAESLISTLEGLARRQGSTMEVAALAYPRMLLALNRGDVNELGRQALSSIDGARLGWGIGQLNATAALAVSRWEAGATSEALATLGGTEPSRDATGLDVDAPFDGPRWSEQLQFPVWLEARGMLRLAAGNTSEALADFERSGTLQGSRAFDTLLLSHLPWRSGAALASMRVGHRERALALAQEELALARECDHPRAIGTALRTLGLVRDGESEAIDVLREAVECHRVSGSGLELARSLTELGAALRRSRSRKESRAPLREAMDVARRCGALVAAKRAETELRASGARPRKLTFSGREGLTPSESRIASLAASGLTNREIAEQLYISRKTVEHHLSSAYRKLDIDSREKLDAALKRGSR